MKNKDLEFICKTLLEEPQNPYRIMKVQVRVRELKTFAINKPVLLIYTSSAFMNRSSTALLS